MSSLNLFLYRSIANLSELTAYETPCHFRVNDYISDQQYCNFNELESIIAQIKKEKESKRNRKMNIKLSRLNDNRSCEFIGKFRYFRDPDVQESCSFKSSVELNVQSIDTTMQTKPVSSNRTAQSNEAKHLGSQAESTVSDTKFHSGLPHLEQLLKNSTNDDISVQYDTLGMLHREISHLHKLNTRLKDEKTTFEQLHQRQMEQTKELEKRCRQLEGELEATQRYQVICSICLETADEIVGHGQRTLLSTFCGHIFCDTCLHRSVLTGKATGDKASKKPFHCPRCRKSLQPSDGAPPFAHALFI